MTEAQLSAKLSEIRKEARADNNPGRKSNGDLNGSATSPWGMWRNRCRSRRSLVRAIEARLAAIERAKV